ncbi:retrotransposon protein, putative, ty1-copia subclass [Tanacetum coccineum]
MQMWMFKRCGTSDTFLVEYRVLRDLISHRSSINNSASLSNKFGECYFIFKFGISGLLYHVVTTIADIIRVVVRYAEFFEKNLLSQEVSRRAGELEEIQDEDTSPSEITRKIPMEVEGFEPPHEEEAHVRRSIRTHRAPEHLCLNVEVEEHKMQSMKDNQVWRLVDLPLNETFSPVADIRAIRILIAIAAFYDYEIWKMDVKTAFLNGYLDEDIYMVKPEGFVNPKHPRKVCKKFDKVMFLVYGGNPEAELQVDCYCDAGFKTDRDDTKSQT